MYNIKYKFSKIQKIFLLLMIIFFGMFLIFKGTFSYLDYIGFRGGVIAMFLFILDFSINNIIAMFTGGAIYRWRSLSAAPSKVDRFMTFAMSVFCGFISFFSLCVVVKDLFENLFVF